MNSNSQFLLPALRCRMGDWIYYVSTMHLHVIVEHVQITHPLADDIFGIRPDPNIESRAKKIANYLLNEEQRFLNSIVIAVNAGDPEWLSLELLSTEVLPFEDISEEAFHHINSTLGLLRFTGKETLFALNGQHRIEGIRQAIEKDKNLRDEKASVIFVGHHNSPLGLARTQRLFSNLNR